MAKTKKIYFQALETLKKEIKNGKYSFRTKLPSEAKLASDLNISGSTLRKVLDQLRNEGLIETRKGSGSFTCNTSVNQLIPVIIRNINPIFQLDELLQGIQDFLEENGLISLPTFYNASDENEIELINNFIEKGNKNMIVFPLSSKSNVSFYQSIMRKGINLAFLDILPENITCDYVSCCNFLGGYMATKKLIEAGHKSIAFCSFVGPETTNTINERFKGYIAALEQNGLTPCEKNIFIRNSATNEDFVNTIVENISATAVFASNDELGFALINKFREINLTLAIIGFDNSAIAEISSLASINQPHYQIGRTVAELLYKRMLNPDKRYEHIYLPVSLVERESLYWNKKT